MTPICRASVLMVVVLNVCPSSPARASIYDAIRQNDYRKVEKMLKSNPQLANCSEEHGVKVTPLHIASVKGSPSMVKLLLSKKANVNALDDNGWTPLYYAIDIDKRQVAELLLSHGANVNIRAKDGMSALLYAVAEDSLEIAKLLISSRADVNVRENKNLYAPLHFAAANGNVKLAQLLIDNGARIDAKEKSGLTPLAMAVVLGDSPMIDLLIARGADINCRDKEGMTPLHLAVGKPLPVSRLDEHGMTLLHSAHDIQEAGNRSRAVVEDLLARGANPNLRDNSGDSPLDRAACVGTLNQEFGAVLPLIQHTDPKNVNSNGATALHWAVILGKRELIEAAIKRGADVNAQIKNGGWSALHFAVYGRQPDAVHLLIESGADVNLRDVDGQTPLGLAVQKGFEDIAVILRKHGGVE